MKRFGSVIGMKEKDIEAYKELHAAAWPEVLELLAESNIHNYSIYLRKMPDGKHYLFSYMEYTGSDFDADMSALGDAPIIKKWWDICTPYQEPFVDRAEGEWWASMEEVFHCD